MRLNAMIAALSLAAGFVLAGGSTVNAQTQNENGQNANPKPPVNVVVKPGDSLSKIASAHQTSYTRLYDANLNVEHPDVIHPGEQLRVPDPSEQLASRPLPNAQPAPAPQPAAAPKATAPAKRQVKAAAAPVSSSGAGVWDRLAQCESGGNWSINTGNGYYGGLQFSLSSWRAVGGSGYPHQASKSEQITRAEMLKARQGWGAWPACSSKLGLR